MLAQVRCDRGRLKRCLTHAYGCTHDSLALSGIVFDFDKVVVFPDALVGDHLGVITYGRKPRTGFLQ